MSKSHDKDGRKGQEFIGFDLGHGETALARAYGGTIREPEILEYQGERSFVTAVARTDEGVKIGAEAVNMSTYSKRSKSEQNIWVKFKSRDLDQDGIAEPTRLFTRHLISTLEREKKIKGPKSSHFIIGCPSGWEAQTREIYTQLFRDTGMKSVRVVPESRAALMTALEQGYLSLDAAKKTVLIIDIGSSTTDFTYCHDLEAEDVGHNFLGSGLLDHEIYKLNLARQAKRKQIEKLIAKYPHYQAIMEYWCRQAKEQYFNGTEKPVEIIKRLPIGMGVLFEIRMDKKDAQTVLDTPLAALNGYTWPQAFNYALSETIEMLGGRAPKTVLLTGGASRLPLVLPASKSVFPKAEIVQGAEPEFAIARGLAWLGRFETLHAGFKAAVAESLSEKGKIYNKARQSSRKLGKKLAPALVDGLNENCILPVFREWRSGALKTFEDIEALLDKRVSDWLSSPQASGYLRNVIEAWFAELQRSIEVETDPLCRDHGLPAMVLSLDDSQHVSQHLDGLSIAAPQVASLESDTAFMGTTVTAIIVAALLAKANLFAPLFLNPIGLIIGGAVAGGGFIFGKKKLEGQFKSANIPVIARQMMTDGRIRKAIAKQRPDLIAEVESAWSDAASERFTQELTETLRKALTERADERAIMFLI